ncbi:SDR family oxidoreductase [Nakamurella sp. A5-74]|uniref:SDR family oxidoreductase n=1 Tax=Nakamurella sp. A5-74 TaxID=3158264 RepID=A0AAU8DL95_9ACTN
MSQPSSQPRDTTVHPDADAPTVTTLVTGATGAAGAEVCRALLARGQRVIAIGRSGQKLAELARQTPGVLTAAADLADSGDVRRVLDEVRASHGPVDGLVHLVGGWRGGKKFTDATEDDWKFLSTNLIDTLRHVTLAIHDDLVASQHGRAVIVSAKAAAKPTAGNAVYATAKAAAEAWQLALADSLRKNQSGRKDYPLPQTSAAVVLVITAIGDNPKFTAPDALAARIAGLFDADAAGINGTRIDLTAPATA